MDPYLILFAHYILCFVPAIRSVLDQSAHRMHLLLMAMTCMLAGYVLSMLLPVIPYLIQNPLMEISVMVVGALVTLAFAGTSILLYVMVIFCKKEDLPPIECWFKWRSSLPGAY